MKIDLKTGKVVPAAHSGTLGPIPQHGGRRGGQRVLFIVALLLAGSGAIRIGTGISEALAQQATAPPPDAAVPGCIPSESTPALIEALKLREQQIAAQERRIANRESALEIANTRIDERLKQLAGAEEALSRTVAIADTAAEEDIGKLVSVYESMKPKEAAPLFQEMSPDFAAGFLSRMRPDAAAAVMAGIDPKQAYLISVVLAGRNAGAPAN